ncbi:MAG: rhodanese-like domain-containing protein [Burkholderiales bacterium]
MREISASELAAWLAQPDAPVVLDVREPWEVAIASLQGSVHIPMREIPARFGELPTARPVVCLCHHGMRSAQVGMFLERQQLAGVCNLTGGIDAWSRIVDPAVPTY